MSDVCDRGVGDREAHRLRRTGPFGVGLRQVERVARRCVADDLGEDLRAPRDGAVPLLEDDDGRTFGDDEPVAVRVERT